jgi:Ni/Fe-hydrogenase subunit HybB-like protein
MIGLALRAAPGRTGALLRAEWDATGPGMRRWLGLLAAGLAIGAVSALIALPPGWEVMGTSPTVEWGLLIVGYAAFAIATSGLCLTSSLGTVFGIDRYRPLERRHAILAILSLTTAFGIIALELHWPFRMLFGVVLSPAPSSPMWWMGVAYGGYLGILVVEIWSMFAHRPRLHQAVCTMAAVMAIVAPSTLGAVFGALPNRPFWHGPVSSLWMLGSALLTGASLLGVVVATVARLDGRGAADARGKVLPGLRPILVLLLLVAAVFVVRFMISGATSSEPGMREAADAVVRGPLAPLFWVVRVLAGLVVPLVLLLLPVGRTHRGILPAGILALLGAFADRYLFVIGGLIAPTSSSVNGVVSAPYASYLPSLVEVGVMIGAVSLVAIVYTLLERYVDLGIYDPHVGLSLAPLRRRRAARAARKAAEREAAERDAAEGTAATVRATEPAARTAGPVR